VKDAVGLLCCMGNSEAGTGETEATFAELGREQKSEVGVLHHVQSEGSTIFYGSSDDVMTAKRPKMET